MSTRSAGLPQDRTKVSCPSSAAPHGLGRRRRLPGAGDGGPGGERSGRWRCRERRPTRRRVRPNERGSAVFTGRSGAMNSARASHRSGRGAVAQPPLERARVLPAVLRRGGGGRSAAHRFRAALDPEPPRPAH